MFFSPALEGLLSFRCPEAITWIVRDPGDPGESGDPGDRDLGLDRAGLEEPFQRYGHR